MLYNIKAKVLNETFIFQTTLQDIREGVKKKIGCGEKSENDVVERNNEWDPIIKGG